MQGTGLFDGTQTGENHKALSGLQCWVKQVGVGRERACAHMHARSRVSLRGEGSSGAS
jgi:hypothetical protein